jgi:hypothetical protein
MGRAGSRGAGGTGLGQLCFSTKRIRPGAWPNRMRNGLLLFCSDFLGGCLFHSGLGRLDGRFGAGSGPFHRLGDGFLTCTLFGAGGFLDGRLL